jgi:DNA-binding LacI/PurR family transcriptional regulator
MPLMRYFWLAMKKPMMGAMAVGILVEQIGHAPKSPSVELATELIVRNSTAAPPDAGTP